jgi:hypothetical protein
MIVEIDGKRVDAPVIDMTVADVRRWAADAQKQAEQPVDLISETLLDGITMAEISLFTGLKQSLDTIKLADLQKLGDAIKASNPAWVRCREKVLELGNKILAQKQSQAKS